MNASMSTSLPGSAPPPALATPAEIIRTTTAALHQLDQTTPEEDLQISVLAAKIDLCNSTAILRYGESIQHRLTSLIKSSLEQALQGLDYSTQNVNDLLSHINTQVEHFDKDNFKSPLSHSKRSRIIRDHYHTITQGIELARQTLDGQRLSVQVRIRTLDELYNQTLQLYQQFKLYLAAGQQELSSVREHQLSQLKAGISDEPGSVLTYRDLENQCGKFEQRLQDLQLSQTLCLQSAVQIQLAKSANQQLALNIQNTITNAFSLWQQTMATALTVKHNQQIITDSNAELSFTLCRIRNNQRNQCTQAAISALVESTQSTS